MPLSSTDDAAEDEGEAEAIVTMDATTTAALWSKIVVKAEEKFGPHCRAFVTDTPSVNKKAKEILEELHPKLTWVPCLAHCLNLFIKDTIVFQQIGTLWTQAKSINHLFYARTGPRSLLKAQLSSSDYPNKIPSNPLKGVLRVCELRFCNSYLILQRLDRIQEVLRTVTVSTAFGDWMRALPKAKDRQGVKEVVALVSGNKADKFWLGVREFLRVIQPVVVLLREVDSNRRMVGQVYVKMSQVDEWFSKTKSPWISAELMKCLQKAWIHRWNYSYCDLYGAGVSPKIQKSFH